MDQLTFVASAPIYSLIEIIVNSLMLGLLVVLIRQAHTSFNVHPICDPRRYVGVLNLYFTLLTTLGRQILHLKILQIMAFK